MEIKLSPIEIIKRRPYMYIRNGIFLPQDVLGDFVTQAHCLGATRVITQSNGKEWGVISNYNWLINNARFAQIDHPFQNIIAEPKLGQNSNYTEIVLTAFASEVVVLFFGEVVYEDKNSGFNLVKENGEFLSKYPLSIFFK